VALAAMRVRGLTPMQVENRCAVDALSYERSPSARFQGVVLLSCFESASSMRSVS
jgi:hypothetical protein